MSRSPIRLQPLQTGSLISFTSSFVTEQIDSSYIRQLSYQAVFTQNNGQPGPTGSIKIEFSNEDQSTSGGVINWFTDPDYTLNFPSVGGTLNGSSSFVKTPPTKEVCANKMRLFVSSSNQTIPASVSSVKISIFGRSE